MCCVHRPPSPFRCPESRQQVTKLSPAGHSSLVSVIINSQQVTTIRKTLTTPRESPVTCPSCGHGLCRNDPCRTLPTLSECWGVMCCGRDPKLVQTKATSFQQDKVSLGGTSHSHVYFCVTRQFRGAASPPKEIVIVIGSF